MAQAIDYQQESELRSEPDYFESQKNVHWCRHCHKMTRFDIVNGKNGCTICDNEYDLKGGKEDVEA